MPKIKKKILNIFFILLLGGLGGILADQFILPRLAGIPIFSNIEFIQQAGNGTVIINPTKEIIITENIAIEEAIDKITPRLVVVHSYWNDSLISQGTGFVVTSDGLIITANDLISTKANKYIIFRNNHSADAQIIKRDSDNNLALLKIEETNLPVAVFADLGELKLGQGIILVGIELIEGGLNRFVNLGIVRSIVSGVLRVDLTEESELANGSPLINIKGEVIGLNLVNKSGLFRIIPSSQIKTFISL